MKQLLKRIPLSMKGWKMRGTLISFVLFLLSLSSISAAALVEYDLVISYKNVNITGRDVKAMTINESIPGPTLRFKEDDLARIHVKNEKAISIFEKINQTPILDTTVFSNKKIEKEDIQHRISKEEYLKTVGQIKSHISKGDIYEMNFCQEFFIEKIQ